MLTHELSSKAVLRGSSRPDLLRNECLPDILSETARRRPAHPALIWGERVVSYSELDVASRQIAVALIHRGAAPGRVAGLFMPRGADLLMAQAGISRSGAAWLPMDGRGIRACHLPRVAAAINPVIPASLGVRGFVE